MKKNLLLISIFCLFSFSSFAASVKRVAEMDERRFFGAIPIYNENKNSPDPKLRKLSEYAANIFSQYFALANKIGGNEMKATLLTIYEEKEYPIEELIERGKVEARRQGIPLIYIKKTK